MGLRLRIWFKAEDLELIGLKGLGSPGIPTDFKRTVAPKKVRIKVVWQATQGGSGSWGLQAAQAAIPRKILRTSTVKACISLDPLMRSWVL